LRPDLLLTFGERIELRQRCALSRLSLALLALPAYLLTCYRDCGERAAGRRCGDRPSRPTDLAQPAQQLGADWLAPRTRKALRSASSSST
jgi:hypothetical protein